MECYPRRGVISFEALSQGQDAVSRACPGLQGAEEAMENMRYVYKRASGGYIRISLRGASLHQKEQKNGERGVQLMNFLIHIHGFILPYSINQKQKRVIKNLSQIELFSQTCVKDHLSLVRP